MGVPGFDMVLGFILNVLGIILLVGIALGILFVLLRRRERQKKVERTFSDHDYADAPPPPTAPTPPTPPAS